MPTVASIVWPPPIRSARAMAEAESPTSVSTLAGLMVIDLIPIIIYDFGNANLKAATSGQRSSTHRHYHLVRHNRNRAAAAVAQMTVLPPANANRTDLAAHALPPGSRPRRRCG